MYTFKMNYTVKKQIVASVYVILLIVQNVNTQGISKPAKRAAIDIKTRVERDSSWYAATTPKIDASTKKISRYEQGLEDYEEAVARVEKTKEEQRAAANPLQQLTSALELFTMLTSTWNRLAAEPRSLYNSTHTLFNYGKDYEQKLIHNITKRDDSSSDVGEGRYIKGDPLKGYYDFVITEGSYKFWAVFQLFTAALMIYSTFAAIYYSKVNPIQSDYDYTQYLGGRSLADDPEPETTDGTATSSSRLSNLINSNWWQSTANGFEFVLDAIDNLPESGK